MLPLLPASIAVNRGEAAIWLTCDARGFLRGCVPVGCIFQIPNKMSAGIEEDVRLFQTIGLSEQKAKETLKNANVTKNLKLAISEVGEVSPSPVNL